ncbi:MAG: hypothetical protein Q8P20_07035 [bacterium]|nr:hypothetical protein [bacterium]
MGKKLPETVKEIYYQDGRNVVCLLVENGKAVAKGVSICSKFDRYDYMEGADKAKKRALEAKGRKQNCQEINIIGRNAKGRKIEGVDIFQLSLAMSNHGTWKGFYFPETTPVENLLLTGYIRPAGKDKKNRVYVY